MGTMVVVYMSFQDSKYHAVRISLYLNGKFESTLRTSDALLLYRCRFINTLYM